MKLCKYQTCHKEVYSKGLCSVHYNQLSHTKRVVDPNTDTSFATERTCVVCGETKKWDKFVMGMDKPSGECRACYRLRILEPEEEKARTKEVQKNWDDLMKFLDRKAKRKSNTSNT